jgi:hypothetical protein
VICPHCGRAAEFHSHRPHTSLSLVGAIRSRRAYYLCRLCGKGLFPFDRDAGLTTRDLTPALERITTLAGAVADYSGPVRRGRRPVRAIALTLIPMVFGPPVTDVWSQFERSLTEPLECGQ